MNTNTTLHIIAIINIVLICLCIIVLCDISLEREERDIIEIKSQRYEVPIVSLTYDDDTYDDMIHLDTISFKPSDVTRIYETEDYTYISFGNGVHAVEMRIDEVRKLLEEYKSWKRHMK